MEQSSTLVNKSNIELAQEYFKALDATDITKLGSIFADDIIWHQPGGSAVSGTHLGKKAVFDLFGKFVELSGNTFDIDNVEAIMSNGDLVSAILHFKADRPGERLDMKGVDLMRIHNGKIQEVWLFSADQEAEDRFWGTR